MGQPLAIVTSQWPIVPMGIYGHMTLRSARVKVIVITCNFLFIFGGVFSVNMPQYATWTYYIVRYDASKDAIIDVRR